MLHHHRSGDKKEAQAYIRKIHHETLRISVIQRLEEYVGLSTEPTLPPAAQDSGDDSDDETRRASPIQPDIGMWVDQCKRTFLWYYYIYLVPSISFRNADGLENDRNGTRVGQRG